jgi:3-phytase
MEAAPDSRAAPSLFAPVDGVRLVADVEGLAIIPDGATGGYLIASSQADGAHETAASAFVAYELENGRLARHFRVVGFGDVDGVTDTDGIEFAAGDFGAPFNEGLLVVQDGNNTPENQNFKFASGGAVLSLLRR